MNDLAPIAVFTYSRLYHLKRTIEALQKNVHADKSILYIFSDGPHRGDEQKVAELRRYIHTIRGFKEIQIIERKENNIVENIQKGIKKVITKHGKIIFLEDDNVTSPFFLRFINDALTYFENDQRIFTINGFNPPVNYKTKYFNDYYLSRYFSAYGFATWENRNINDVIEKNDYYLEIQQNKLIRKKIRQNHGT